MAAQVSEAVAASFEYVRTFKLKLLERLLGEQVKAIGASNRLTERDVQEYQKREVQIRRVSLDLGLDHKIVEKHDSSVAVSIAS